MILPVLDPPAGIVVGMGFVMALCPDIMGAPLMGVNQGQWQGLLERGKEKGCLVGCGKTYFDLAELRWPTGLRQEENTSAGCSKWPSSKAAADESTGGVASFG
jgi:hypothetical protein